VTSIFPVFIGVVGKRAFHTAASTASQQVVRQRLSETFDYIDSVFPDVSKVLLTGAASGSDLIAAEEILGDDGERAGRANWLVVAALPFDEELYKQDFNAEQWKTFKRVVSHPRTRAWVLPRLACGSDDLPSDADLARSPRATETQKDLRRRHYEQVGLWIADTANVLIAVMPQGEVIDKIGGSARIVACRRGARPDWTTRGIIHASQVLAPRPELIRPPQGYIWLIDPSSAVTDLKPPVIILPPFVDERERHAGSSKPGYVYDGDKMADCTDSANRKRHLRLSEIPFHISERRERAKLARIELESETARQPTSWPDSEEPVGVLSDITDALRKSAAQAEKRSRSVFRTITWLFLLTILSFEIYTKFYPHQPEWLMVYAAFFSTIIGLYLFARSRRWQAIAEDRRAVREILRIQLAWWRAGLSNRVDFVHLQGADHDLGRVRDVARSAIVWACLVCRFRSPAECWPLVCSAKERPTRSRSNKFPDDWVGNQAFYFWLRKGQREHQAHIAESLSWMLFITAGCLAFLLFLIQLGGELFAVMIEHWRIYAISPYGKWMLLLAAFALLVLVSALFWTRGFLGGPHSEKNVITQSVALGLASAICLCFAIYLAVLHAVANSSLVIWVVAGAGLAVLAFCSAYALRKLRPDSDATFLGAGAISLGAVIVVALMATLVAAVWSSHAAEIAEKVEYLIIVFVVFLTALAAAFRFLAEKLAIEAEALKYRDAGDWFDRADELLRGFRGSNWDETAKHRAQEIVRELGVLALRESEAWLSARRERPLTPIM
jgi:hypothetical protein